MEHLNHKKIEMKIEEYRKNAKKIGRPKQWTKEDAEREYQAFLKWREDPNNVFIGIFADQRGYTTTTMHQCLFPLHPIFKKTYNEVFEAQALRISDGALKNKYNPHFSQFILKCNHGYREPKLEEEQAQVAASLKELAQEMRRSYEAQNPVQQETDTEYSGEPGEA